MSTGELSERGRTVAWVPRREVDTTQGGSSQGPVELSGRTPPVDTGVARDLSDEVDTR